VHSGPDHAPDHEREAGPTGSPADSAEPVAAAASRRLAGADAEIAGVAPAVPAGARFDVSEIPLCSVVDLTRPRARWLAEIVAANVLAPWVTLRACRRGDSYDMVECTLLVEVPQLRAHDIRGAEPVAIVFGEEEGIAPEVLAVRSDFPTDVPHRNLTGFVWPVSLCLYDVRFRDIAAQWTPTRFLTRIQEWFQLTARGELHGDDQPAEPLFLGSPHVVVLPHQIVTQALVAAPADFSATMCLDLPITLDFRGTVDGPFRLVAAVPVEAGASSGNPPRVALVVRTRPRTHGAIHTTPATLQDVFDALVADGDTPVQALREGLRRLAAQEPAQLGAMVVLVLVVPVRRKVDAPVTTVQTVAVLTILSACALGQRLGLWDVLDGEIGMLLSPGDVQPFTDDPIVLATTYRTMSRDGLAHQQGFAAAVDRHVVAVGAGALGSQVMLHAARGARGRWTVIDHDLLLPHNVARHTETAALAAYPKAMLVANRANQLADSPHVHNSLEVDVLAPGASESQLTAALTAADLVVDLSASVTVARALARDLAGAAPRISLYLSPSGRFLSLLAEDSARTARLDTLEMQLYRAAIHDMHLTDIFTDHTGRIRYGQSCRDVSVALPQATLAVHAGVAAHQLSRRLTSDDSAPARIAVWIFDNDSGAVAAHEIPVDVVHERTSQTWRLVIDEGLLREMYTRRAQKLPSETGGVLLGHYDFTRRIVYIIATMAAPADSYESPDAFIRGHAGLAPAVARVQDRTAGQVTYIGEWHSHPTGSSCWPSVYDERLFTWLRGVLQTDSLPPLMMIVGDDGAVPYIETLPSGHVYPAIFPATPIAGSV
jgi:integrative and conjugative element protein (TIGR02256 family)